LAATIFTDAPALPDATRLGMSIKPSSAPPVATVRIASAVPFDGMMVTLRPSSLK
jgi:hypothetical protein